MDTSSLDRLITDLTAIDGHAERARAATDLLHALAEVQQQIKEIRQDDVIELRKSRTLREVGEELGMTTARVDQIAKAKRRD
ncbi:MULTISPECIES: hypothetical protein [Actinomadura]|uniref:RNA polymerase sigma-70 region 4 domain-containing protein n=1 Tax=Actinomadura yumaensis TaxID=111807 RepID=A0ABW2CYL5_9ACTN|nr:hypothetical protein [Actinomadura sp. J1-007]MWK36380.1 hypothetical protein [Actinomadura sp. J1-007]